MNRYTLYYSGLNREILVTDISEKLARNKVWDSMSDDEKNRVESVECVFVLHDVDDVPNPSTISDSDKSKTIAYKMWEPRLKLVTKSLTSRERMIAQESFHAGWAAHEVRNETIQPQRKPGVKLSLKRSISFDSESGINTFINNNVLNDPTKQFVQITISSGVTGSDWYTAWWTEPAS